MPAPHLVVQHPPLSPSGTAMLSAADSHPGSAKQRSQDEQLGTELAAFPKLGAVHRPSCGGAVSSSQPSRRPALRPEMQQHVARALLTADDSGADFNRLMAGATELTRVTRNLSACHQMLRCLRSGTAYILLLLPRSHNSSGTALMDTTAGFRWTQCAPKSVYRSAACGQEARTENSRGRPMCT